MILLEIIMEAKMGNNKIWVYGTCLILLLLIGIPSTYKVITKHNERMLKYTTQKIVEAAKDCYYNNSCVKEQITLEEIYEKTGLVEMHNPVSKKIYNKNSYVSVKDNFKFIEILE